MKSFECFGLDTANQCLLRSGAPVDLAPKPFAVLRYLVENPGRLITHDELLDAVWPETYVQPQVLRTYMLELRKVLGDDPGQPRFIQTLPKRGYRFVAQVTEKAQTEPGSANRRHSEPVSAAPIIGRGAELARLEQHFQLARRGERQVVFVSGEAGIGKTSVVDAFCRELTGSTPASVGRSQCLQGIGRTEEYYPVLEALRSLCAGEDGEAACRVLERLAPAWVHNGRGLDPDSNPRPVTADRTLGDLCSALDALAEEKPLILLFEDLHWADASTIQLISALARQRSKTRLLVLATCTPQHGSGEELWKQLKNDLMLRRLCAEILLEPFKRAAVQELVARELGQADLPSDMADFVFQRSEGNPLFVIAVVEHLIALGVLVSRCIEGVARWEQCAPFPEMEAGVPDPLVRMIELEIERLSEEEQRLLEAGSLMSVAFPAWAVAAALDKDPLETEEACDALARRLHFVVRAGEDELPGGLRSAFYVFGHGLYREVLYQRQAAARRHRRHMRVADRLGELFAGQEANVARERSMHYEAAGDLERAARVLEAGTREDETAEVY
jgi:predicted ATPase